MCSAGAGFYHVSAYVEEARRWGIEVRLPSVNHSRMEYTAEGEIRQTRMCVAPLLANGKRALRVGLMQVKGLRVETITAIVRAREEDGAFRSLADFLRRVPPWNRDKPVEKDEIEALIKCGALDEGGDQEDEKARGMTRPEVLSRWR